MPKKCKHGIDLRKEDCNECYYEEMQEHLKEEQARCPHGQLRGQCNTCAVLDDQAFDAAGEDRVFGRSR